MKLVFKSIERIEEVVALAFLSIMIVVMITQVSFRFFNLSSLTWSDELCRFLFIWITFIGASLVVKKSEHLGVSVLIDRFNDKPKLVINAFVVLISAIFCSIVAYEGYKTAISQLETGQLSASMSIPMGSITLAIPIGATLVLIAILEKIYNQWNNWRQKA